MEASMGRMRGDSKSFMKVAPPQAKAPRRAGVKATAAPPQAEEAVAPAETTTLRHVAVVLGLRKADAAAAGVDPPPPVGVRLARVATQDLPRAEIDLASKKGTRVHLYEAYWAPITEGRVKLRDVWSFLWRGGWNGIANARGDGGVFRRWMFGGPKELPISVGAAGGLFAVLTLLLSLGVVNAAAAAVAAALTAGPSTGALLSAEVIDATAMWIGGCLVVAAVFSMLMLASKARVFLAPAMAALIGCGVATVVVPIVHQGDLAANPASWKTVGWLPLVVWGAVLWASWLVRSLLTQYVGDVAAYVSPHELDRFQDIRTRIKKAVREVAEAVYRHRDPAGKPVYETVAVVAHSLGSVAAYDCLNSLINGDILDPPNSADVVKRTSLFLTFGSPLDKTAFVFKSQGRSTDEPREALAAAVQPMIQSYDFRAFPWVNVYADGDVISGKLDYYDDPTETRVVERVQNKVDPVAKTPLAAHVEYWGGTLVYEELLARL
jgi:hypothetical protein